MFVNDSLSRLHIKAQEDAHYVGSLHCLPYLNIGHTYHRYKYQKCTLYKDKAKQQVQININLKEVDHQISPTVCKQQLQKNQAQNTMY